MTEGGELPEPAPRKVGVVVVHGIGKPEPGDCIETLAASLASRGSGLVLSNHPERRLLEEYPRPESSQLTRIRRGRRLLREARHRREP